MESHYGDTVEDLELRSGPNHVVSYAFDSDEDGTIDFGAELPLADVAWVHSSDSSSIWVRTIPIADRYAQMDTKALLLDYIDRIAGSGVTLAKYDGKVVAEASRFGTKLTSSSAATLGDAPAHSAELEVVNLDQLEADQSTSRRHVKLVLAHSPRRLPVRGQFESKSVILAGYSAREADYPKHTAEFEELLREIDLEVPER